MIKIRFLEKVICELETELFLILIAIFAGSFVRSAFGFGDAMLSMPILAMLVGLEVAAPLIAIVECMISSVILSRGWRQVEMRSVWMLVLFSLIGIPVGIYFLKNLDARLMKLLLAVLIILFTGWMFFNKRKTRLKNRKLAPLFGLLAGIVGSAYNTNGPFAVIYGSLRGWDAQKFRATLQGYFLPVTLFIVTGHAIAGNITPEIIKYSGFSIPVVFLAFWLGNKLHHSIQPEKFRKYVLGLLFVLAVLLMVNTVFF